MENSNPTHSYCITYLLGSNEEKQTLNFCLLSGLAHGRLKILRELGFKVDAVASDENVSPAGKCPSWEYFKNLCDYGISIEKIKIQNRSDAPSLLFDGDLIIGRTLYGRDYMPDVFHFHDFYNPRNFDRSCFEIDFDHIGDDGKYSPIKFCHRVLHTEKDTFMSVIIPPMANFSMTFYYRPLFKC